MVTGGVATGSTMLGLLVTTASSEPMPAGGRAVELLLNKGKAPGGRSRTMLPGGRAVSKMLMPVGGMPEPSCSVVLRSFAAAPPGPVTKSESGGRDTAMPMSVLGCVPNCMRSPVALPTLKDASMIVGGSVRGRPKLACEGGASSRVGNAGCGGSTAAASA